MSNNVFFTANEVFENSFEGFEEFNADLTLDNVDPWLLLATYNSSNAA